MVNYLTNEEFVSAGLALDVKWNQIWKWRGTPRVRSFLWLATHGKLLTNYQRFTRHICPDPTCAKCQLTPETTLHVLWDCPATKNLWLQILPPALRRDFFSLNLQEWIMHNLIQSNHRVAGITWSMLFCFLACSLWKERNSTQVGGNSPNHTLLEYCFREIRSFISVESHVQGSGARNPRAYCQWTPPKGPDIKFNVDARWTLLRRKLLLAS